MRNSMAEISKNMKILIIIHIVIAIIYGFLYLVIPEIFSTLNDAPYFDPHVWRLWGGTLIVLVIFGVVMIKVAEWENIKVFWGFVIIWIIMILIIDLATLFTISRSATNIASLLVDIVILIVLAITDIYFYMQEEKR